MNNHQLSVALDKAIRVIGTVSAFASVLGVPSSLPSMWRKRGCVPARHCPAIERVTGGAVRCEDLCPEVDWAVLRQAAGQPPTPQPQEVRDAA